MKVSAKAISGRCLSRSRKIKSAAACSRRRISDPRPDPGVHKGEGNMSAVARKQPQSDPKARFRNAPRKVDFTIDQDWRRYTPAEHDRWDRLFKRSQAILRGRA